MDTSIDTNTLNALTDTTLLTGPLMPLIIYGSAAVTVLLITLFIIRSVAHAKERKEKKQLQDNVRAILEILQREFGLNTPSRGKAVHDDPQLPPRP
jgi:hypothetical protein